MTQEIKPSELDFEVYQSGKTIFITDADGAFIGTAVKKEDAEFICRSANNFYPLLEALKTAQSFLNDSEIDAYLDNAQGEPQDPRDLIEQAIANAEAQGARDE